MLTIRTGGKREVYRKGQLRSPTTRSAARAEQANRSEGGSELAGTCRRLFDSTAAERGAAEVCKLVQLSSGSTVYPERHDELCLLRAAGHDEDRVDP